MSGIEFTKQRFQWFFDLQTKKDQMTIISVSAGGEEVRKRLAGFFGMFRYFKLGSVGIKLIPASTLPVDPTGLSLEAGETTVDPRDQLNPGMMRITNGESIVHDLRAGTPTVATAEKERQIYNSMLLDPRWFKFMLQKGVSRSAYPLYWNVGQLAQDIYPGAITNIYDNPGVDGNTSALWTQIKADGTVEQIKKRNCSDPRGLFQTGEREKLGWLPTTIYHSKIPQFDGGAGPDFITYTPVPEIEVMDIILPPAYKTIYYYRCFVTEEVSFKEVVANIPANWHSSLASASLDNFQYVEPQIVGPPINPGIPVPKFNDPNDGGGTHE